MRGYPRLNKLDPLSQGLVYYYSLDSYTISGTTVRDLSGNRNDGATVSSPAPASALFGQSLAFSSSYVTTPSITYSSTAFALACWVYIGGGSGYRTIFRFDTGSGSFGPGFYLNSSGFLDMYLNATDNQYAVVPPNNAWWHYCVTAQNDNWTLYVNGIARASTTWSIGSITSVGKIGNDNFSQFWNGRLKDFRLYNRALSPADVARLASNTSGGAGLLVPRRLIIGAGGPVQRSQIVTLTLAEALSSGNARGHPVALVLAETLKLKNQGRVIRSALLGQTLKVKNQGRAIRKITLAETLTAKKQARHKTPITLGETFVSAQIKTKLQSAAAAQAETITVIKQAGSQGADFLLGQTTNVLKQVSSQSVDFSLAQVLATLKQVTHVTAVTLTESFSAAAIKTKLQSATATLAEIISVARRASLARAVSITQTITTRNQARYTITLALAQTVSIVRRVGKLIAFSVGQIITAGTVVIRNGLSVPFLQTQAFSASTIKARSQSAAVALTETVAVRKQTGKLAAIASAQIVAVKRRAGKAVAFTNITMIGGRNTARIAVRLAQLEIAAAAPHRLTRLAVHAAQGQTARVQTRFGHFVGLLQSFAVITAAVVSRVVKFVALRTLSPTPSRTVTLTRFLPSMAFDLLISAGQPSWPDRTTQDGLDYWIDTTGMFDAGDDLGAISVALQPNGINDLALDWTMIAGQFACFYLSGGVVGQSYAVGINVQSKGGRSFSITGTIAVTAAGTLSLSPGPLTLPANTLLIADKPLVLPSGQVLVLPGVS
jgi:hypothetical protein